jgi:hypothetical protein
MRELNPNLNAMLHSTEQMNKVLCEASKQPLKKRRKIASSVVALHDAHLQRLKAFKSDPYNIYDPLAQAFAQQPSMPDDDEPTIQPPQVEEEDESSLGSRAAMERVMADIPKKFHAKVTSLGRYLKANPNLIRVTPTGRPIVAGTELGRANIIDIMRSLYVWPKSQALPSGVKEVMEALHSAGAPSYLLSNSAVRTMYQHLHEPGEQSHAETQTETEEPEQEEEQGHEYGEEVTQKPKGEAETTLYRTPEHSAIRPQPPIPRLEERAPARSMKQVVKKTGDIHPKPEASKASRIPTGHASSKASTSQKGTGRKDNFERVRLPGKPIRILYLPEMKPTRNETRKANNILVKHASSKATVSQAGKGYKAKTEHVRLPGKPIRILRLY